MLEKKKWIASVLLGVLALIVPVVLYVISLPVNSLMYEVVSKSDLIDASALDKDIEIKVEGEVVSQASIYSIIIKNDGTEPITAKDFEREIYIFHEDGSKVFSAQILNKKPSNIEISFSIESNIVSINPFLFNPGEEFELELLSSSKEYPSIDYRIAGLTEINQNLPHEKSTQKKIIVIILCFMLALFYMRSAWFLTKGRVFPSNKLSIITNIALSVTCVFTTAFLLVGHEGMIMDIKGSPVFYIVLNSIAFLVGLLSAIMETKYNKSN